MLVQDLNPVLRGWGNYFRTGNAARKFNQVDRYVVSRLKRLRDVRTSSPAGHGAVPRAPYLGGRVMLRHERPSVSRVREIRTHGLKGGPTFPAPQAKER